MSIREEIRKHVAQILAERGFLPRTVPGDLLTEAVGKFLAQQRKENIFDLRHFAGDVVQAMLFGPPGMNRYRRAPVGVHYWSVNDKDLLPSPGLPVPVFPFQAQPRRFRYLQSHHGLYAVETLPGGRFEVYRISSGEVRQLYLELKLSQHRPAQVTHVMWVEKVRHHPQDGNRAAFQMLPDAGRWRLFSPPNTKLYENYIGGLNADEGLVYFHRWLLLAEQRNRSPNLHGPRPPRLYEPLHLNLFFDDSLRAAEVEAEVREVFKTSAFRGWCF